VLDESFSAISNQLRHVGFSFECFLADHFNLGTIPIVYLKNLEAYLLPLALFMTFMILFLFGVAAKKL
jgi:hypothetical protein